MIAALRAAWKRLRAHFWASLAVDAALILAVFYAIHAWQTRDLPIDQAAPATVLAELGGSAMLPALSEAETGIVYFFAPWCFYCRSSIGNLDTLVSRGSVAWATVVALDYESPGEVKEFIDRTGVTLPVLMGTPQTARDWSVQAFPTYYVIDAKGRISSRSVGYSTLAGMWLRAKAATF